jgi:DNA-binding XRE family transcriptional regulator
MRVVCRDANGATIVRLAEWKQFHRAPSVTGVAGKARRASRSARTSKVTVVTPCDLAAATRAAQWAAGMPPLARQVLTVEAAAPVKPATLPVPPSASMIESASMDGDNFRVLRKRQDFACCKRTFSPDRVAIRVMGTPKARDARRLIATRKALGYEHQGEFCKAIGVSQSVISDIENGNRNISVGVARKIKKRFNIPLDWTLDGDPAFIPRTINIDLDEAA